MRMSVARSSAAACVVAACVGVSTSRGQEASTTAATTTGAPTTQPGIYGDVSSRQEQIRKRTAALAGQLDDLIGDYAQSGLSADPEVLVLREARAALSELSDEEMAEIVSLLDKGSGTDAKAAQDRVVARLKQVLAEYQKRKDAQALAARVHELMLRQQAALRNTVTFVKRAGNKPWEDVNGPGKGAMAIMQADQRSLNAEVAELQHLPPETLAKLQEQLQAAASDLEQGAVFRAAAHQREARDLLRQMQHEVSPERDRKKKLEDAAADLDREIALQKGVLADVTSAHDPGRFPQFEQREGDLADLVDETRADLWELLQPASTDAGLALRSIQASRTKLDQRTPVAAQDQQAAVEFLTSARNRVAAELAKQPDISPEDQKKLDEINQRQRELDKLIEQQARAAQRAEDAAQAPAEKRAEKSKDAAAEQAEAQKQAEAQQPELNKTNPDAARATAKAQQKMDAAQDALGKGKPSDARPQQDAAEKKLEEAQRDLSRQAEKLNGKLNDDRAEAQQAAKDAAAQAADAERKLGDPNQPTDAQADQLAKSAQDVAKSAARTGDPSMEEAKQALREASAAARNGDRDRAKDAAERAKQSLAQAEKSLRAPPSEQGEPSKSADGTRSSAATGSNSDSSGRSANIGLPPRERAALQQSSPESYPPEYRGMIEQYLKSLTGSGDK